ncbi:VNG_1110C family protein [Halopelagius longus]|uniref:Uncharacterized protein n=1 Tax=Halopelagius longus TaxID=1236180 RepID=A0A1H1C4G9_9EURY|nr:hypothetical protein [Halopelagius longus]RDI73012.1 hypothetical protein DWB78_04590 [Halopelagius longus]SDQ59098.1 hypothetical protein SAMN05216278_2109 [Halopelagius longus]
MPDASTFRDRTEITVPCESLSDVRDELESEFTVTVFPKDGICRIIASPVEIRAVEQFLTNRGVTVR